MLFIRKLTDKPLTPCLLKAICAWKPPKSPCGSYDRQVENIPAFENHTTDQAGNWNFYKHRVNRAWTVHQMNNLVHALLHYKGSAIKSELGFRDQDATFNKCTSHFFALIYVVIRFCWTCLQDFSWFLIRSKRSFCHCSSHYRNKFLDNSCSPPTNGLQKGLQPILLWCENLQ